MIWRLACLWRMGGFSVEEEGRDVACEEGRRLAIEDQLRELR